MASAPTEIPSDPAPRALGNLRMVWHFATRYPGRITIALAALAGATRETTAIDTSLARPAPATAPATAPTAPAPQPQPGVPIAQ